MINLPYVTMPDSFVKLLVSNIQNSTQINNNLEIFLTDNKDLNILVKKYFRDIDADGFLGKIISVSGWNGIRNRLAAVFIEFAMNGVFPEEANITLVNDLINLENKLRHFTVSGYSRAFLLGLYSKLSVIKINRMDEIHDYSPLIINNELIDLMKFSKSKSTRIDWLMLELALMESLFGLERLTNLLKGEVKYNALFNILKNSEKDWYIENIMSYGASIGDYEFFLSDASMVA